MIPKFSSTIYPLKHFGFIQGGIVCPDEAITYSSTTATCCSKKGGLCYHPSSFFCEKIGAEKGWPKFAASPYSALQSSICLLFASRVVEMLERHVAPASHGAC